MFNLVVDRIVDNEPWPTLQAYPRRDSAVPWAETWPYTQPPDLVTYCKEFDVAYNLYTTAAYPANSYYIVHLGFFDFAIDYVGLLPECVRDAVRLGRLRILFYYHEGDDPFKIKNRLDSLCAMWDLTYDAYRFVSGNTAAATIENFVWFADHELLYYIRNRTEQRIFENTGSLPRTFTALARRHQWWRATALADLNRQGLLDNSYWSYNPGVRADTTIADCPIKIDNLNIRSYLAEFVAGAPYLADDLTVDEHNNHSITYMPHYANSSCNIVFETLFDADGSGGAFVSEKTFKPIKHSQPFVVAGCAGTLQLLRDLGYRTFDRVINNRYDLIQDNTRRWFALRAAIAEIKHGDLDVFRARCAADVEHNRSLFSSTKANRLNILSRKLLND